MPTPEQVLRDALAMSQKERATVIASLLQNLEADEETVQLDQSLLTEIESRIERHDRGETPTVDAMSALDRIEDRLKRRSSS